ncbi:MAG: hypothetical protein QM809_18345 [Gordonia sp. (in: high G+C Gram-positive bacteria)]|uniref:hypothetical protein n=1 Tax=Gordonia sp. (in: high G+C Gram-positive bacteria) TaxID=84139 RepID=UPI0039E4E4FB
MSLISKEWIFSSFRHYAPQIVLAFGTTIVVPVSLMKSIGFRLGQDYYLEFKIWLAVLSCLLIVAGTLWSGRRSFRVQELQSKYGQVEAIAERYKVGVQEIVDKQFFQLLEECELIKDGGLPKGEVRITLYFHVKSYFIPVARIAGNPKLSQMARSSYPDDEGLIKFGWEKAGGIVDFLRSDEDELTAKEWIERVTSNGWNAPLSKEAASKIRMKSLKYYMHRLHYGSEAIGLIVVESTVKNGFPNNVENKLKKANSIQDLCQLLNTLKSSHISNICDDEIVSCED